MMRVNLLACALAPLIACGHATVLTDHHQHLFSPAAGARSTFPTGVSAERLIRAMDSAGIRRAVLLSVAYQFGNPNRPPVEDEYAKVRAENDWTAEQAAQFPDRLQAVCSVNPLKSYALDELERCSHDPRLNAAIKLHFGNSDIDLDNPAHVSRMEEFFQRANERRMAIITHMHANVNLKRPYGAKQASVFLNRLVSRAPDVAIQIAHFAGAGGFGEPASEEALDVFLAAITSHSPLARHLYFDISALATTSDVDRVGARIAERARALGLERILFGTDAIASGPFSPVDATTAYRRIPFTDAEFRRIASNAAPYLRWH